MKLERRAQITELIKKQKTVNNAELMERFGISIETVRRDLDALEKQGVLRKVYGGAVISILLNSEPEFASRSQMNAPQKNAIAEAAAKLIEPGDAIFLGVGTTVQAMVQYMKHIPHLTVFTNALRVAIALSEIPDCTVILLGGQLRSDELTVSGFPAEETLAHFNIDKAFIGIGGVTEKGLTDFHTAEAQFHRRVVLNAKQSIALADASKMGIRAMNNICSLEQISLIITDSHTRKQTVSRLKEAGARIVVAK